MGDKLYGDLPNSNDFQRGLRVYFKLYNGSNVIDQTA